MGPEIGQWIVGVIGVLEIGVVALLVKAMKGYSSVHKTEMGVSVDTITFLKDEVEGLRDEVTDLRRSIRKLNKELDDCIIARDKFESRLSSMENGVI